MSFKGFMVETVPRFRGAPGAQKKDGEYQRSVNIPRRRMAARMKRLGLTSGRQKVRLRKSMKAR